MYRVWPFSIGFMVTELAINALKHAFRGRRRPGQQVIVG